MAQLKEYNKCLFTSHLTERVLCSDWGTYFNILPLGGDCRQAGKERGHGNGEEAMAAVGKKLTHLDRTG